MCALLMKGCNVADLAAKVPRFAEYNSGQDGGNVGLPIFQHRSSVCPAAWPRAFKPSTATSKCLIFPHDECTRDFWITCSQFRNISEQSLKRDRQSEFFPLACQLSTLHPPPHNYFLSSKKFLITFILSPLIFL